ncbi:MAG: hypothetical protein FJX70_06885 [Alphaproteobacteria bacterium]|nr:hypothetical protein [Alphaproteobacteria bacterium]
MNHKIRKLLDKKKLTGEELGKAYIITQLQKKITKEFIFSDEEIKILVAKVVDQSEIDKANAYINFYNWLDRSSFVVKSDYHTFYVGFSRSYIKLYYTMESEQGFNNLKNLVRKLNIKDNNYQQLQAFTENILSIMSVFDQVEDKESLDFMKEGKSMIEEGLSSILSYNKAVDLFADFFKIPEISKVFKVETEKLFTAINMLNDRIVLVRNFLYGSEKEVLKKCKILDYIYPVINIPDFEPPEKNIKRALKSLRNSIFSYTPYRIIKILQGYHE